ncbi:phage tail protein [Jeotgalicoccus sp. FSL K6-3177]|uniref:phage tail protein n=1 Tax=Jeotgalicoccus sp. FSL K6-3177 TaxID=2921494 RepID=UPI0030FD61C9
MPLFYWGFSKSIIHENHDGSHTANSAFRTVFEGTGFNFVLVDFSPAVTIEGFGKGSNRLELFKRLLDRYNYEFEIQGRTVYMKHLIGNDTNYMYKYRLNASNVSENIDASGMFTYIRGFGDFEEGEEDYFNNAGLQDDYLSPLAEIVTKPGQLPDEGPPIVDGRISQIDTLQEAMKKAVEESLAITIEGTLHDVRQMGYDIAVPVKGDRVWLHDERISLEKEIRLNKIVTTYDEKDNIIACDVTFGSQSIGERHKANINSLSKRFADLLTGKLKLPVISLEQVGMDMINAIHAASSEIIFGDFGMMAISKPNPNNVFGLNSEGWYISQDGGRTPKVIATAKGILADALYAGTLWLTNEMNIESADGYLNVTGSRFVMRSKNNSDAYVEISPDGIIVSEGFMTIYGKDGRIVMEDGYMRGSRVANIIDFYTGSIVSFQGRNLMWDSYDNQRVKYIDDQYKGRFLDLVIATGLSERSQSTSAHAIVTVRDFPGTVVASERFLIRRQNDDAEMDFRRIRCDLQALFNIVPDYRTVSLYVEVQLDSAYSGNEILFRINKGEFHA